MQILSEFLPNPEPRDDRGVKDFVDNTNIAGSEEEDEYVDAAEQEDEAEVDNTAEDEDNDDDEVDSLPDFGTD